MSLSSSILCINSVFYLDFATIWLIDLCILIYVFTVLRWRPDLATVLLIVTACLAETDIPRGWRPRFLSVRDV